MTTPEDTFPDDHLDYDAGALRQALFDVYEALGFDTDGDRTPAGWKNLRKVVINAAKEFRSDYDDALEEQENFLSIVKQREAEFEAAAKRDHEEIVELTHDLALLHHTEGS